MAVLGVEVEVEVEVEGGGRAEVQAVNETRPRRRMELLIPRA
jgi:hypothetical protein